MGSEQIKGLGVLPCLIVIPAQHMKRQPVCDISRDFGIIRFSSLVLTLNQLKGKEINERRQ